MAVGDVPGRLLLRAQRGLADHFSQTLFPFRYPEQRFAPLLGPPSRPWMTGQLDDAQGDPTSLYFPWYLASLCSFG